ncbi:MAG: class I SAM-dependent methyltransferase [Eggerthellaceae bacterium]|nr:class I SAM-dependent methyltransferase [Eggerthellaceae bacterium]
MNEIEAYFDEKAPEWDTHCDCPGIKHMAVAHIAGVTEGARVLDVGCGTGVMEPALCACGAKSIVALDLSEKMIEIASSKYPSMPVTFEQACVIEYATRDGIDPFDVVVIYNAYPHILDKEALVSAVSRLLAPRGRFLVAHGASKEMINAHHADVPENVTSGLKSAEEESAIWRDSFEIDVLVDTPHFYCFGGSKREA